LQPALELSIIRRKQADDGGRNTLAKSQWSFKTATELSAALAAKTVSAVELAQDAIHRIERHDGKINARFDAAWKPLTLPTPPSRAPERRLSKFTHRKR